MGLETPNAGPFPYDVFIGRGWEEAFRFEASEGVDDDLSDVTAVRVGLTRKGLPAQHYELTQAGGQVDLAIVPDDGEEPVGDEPPNGICIVLAPADNADWVAGLYAFDIALTRGDGSIDTTLEGLVEVRTPA